MQRVMNKWAPALLKTWKDEIGLAVILVATINAQIRLMHMLEEQRKKTEPVSREKVTPISTPAKQEPEKKLEPVAAQPADVLDEVGLNL